MSGGLFRRMAPADREKVTDLSRRCKTGYPEDYGRIWGWGETPHGGGGGDAPLGQPADEPPRG